MTKVFSIALFVIATLVSPHLVQGQAPRRVVHVFVALCDNVNQGIVPVPPRIGNGDDPEKQPVLGGRLWDQELFRKERWTGS